MRTMATTNERYEERLPRTDNEAAHELAQRIQVALDQSDQPFSLSNPTIGATFRYWTAGEAMARADECGATRFFYKEGEDYRQVHKVDNQWWVRGEKVSPGDAGKQPGPFDKTLSSLQEGIDHVAALGIATRMALRAAASSGGVVSHEIDGQMAGADANSFQRIQNQEKRSRAATDIAVNARRYPAYKQRLEEWGRVKFPHGPLAKAIYELDAENRKKTMSKATLLAGDLGKIAMGEIYSDRILQESVEYLQALREQPEHANPAITKDRIVEAIVHCKLALHGVRDTHHRLADAAWVILTSDGLGVEHHKPPPADEDARWRMQAKGLRDVTASINAALAPEVIKADFNVGKLREYGDDVGLEFGGKVESFDDGTISATFKREVGNGVVLHVALMAPPGAAQVIGHVALGEGERVLVESEPMSRDSVIGALDAAVASFDGLKLRMREIESPMYAAKMQRDENRGEAMNNIYNVSVTFEIVTDESAEQTDAAERGYEREREDMDADELERLVREYGFSEPSCSSLTDSMWFSTASPLQDRAYREKGEERFFSLHLHSVNGESPTLEDYADIARMASIRMPELATVGSRIQPDDDEPSAGPGP